MIKEKLQKARIELQEMKLKKSGENKYSEFKYYELADFLPQVNKMFYDLKLFSNFSMELNEATLTVTDWEDNTFEKFTTPVEELELKGCNKIQALGGVHTYLKRYLYLNALEIVESDMFDANTEKPEETSKPKQQPKKNEAPKGELTKDDEMLIVGVDKCETVEQLEDFYKEISLMMSCEKAKAELVKACKQRKELLTNGQ